MENQQKTIQQNSAPAEQQKTDRQLLEEIHKFSRKTKNYMMWQLIITVALVVLPLIAALAIIPYAMSSLGSIYGGGLVGPGEGDSAGASLNVQNLQSQLKQLQQ